MLTERELFGERVRSERDRKRRRGTARDPGQHHPRPHRADARRADRARRPWRGPLPGPGVDGRRRHGRRVPDHRIRQGRQALRAGGAAGPGQPLLRHRAGAGAAAFAGRRCVGARAQEGRRKGTRRRRRTAGDLRPARGARRRVDADRSAAGRGVRRQLPVRGNPRPGTARSRPCSATWPHRARWTA